MNQAIQDSIDAQRNMRALTTAIVTKAAQQLLDPMGAAKAVTEESTDNALAGQIISMLGASGAAVGSNGQIAKIVYATVPPNPTGVVA